VQNGQEEKETIIMEDDLKHTHTHVCVGEGSCLVCHFFLPKKEFDFLSYSLAHVRVVGELCSILSNIFWGGEGRFTFFFFLVNTHR
jgi:hypothetical protein